MISIATKTLSVKRSTPISKLNYIQTFAMHNLLPITRAYYQPQCQKDDLTNVLSRSRDDSTLEVAPMLWV